MPCVPFKLRYFSVDPNIAGIENRFRMKSRFLPVPLLAVKIYNTAVLEKFIMWKLWRSPIIDAVFGNNYCIQF
jgi:hypothetical protein